MSSSTHPIDQFAASMAAHGLVAPESLVPDGRIHRFSTNGKRGDTAGGYVLHLDPIAAGAFWDWRTGLYATWCIRNADAMSPAERRLHEQRMAAHRAQSRRDKTAAMRKNRERIDALWRGSVPVTEGDPVYTYLRSRGLILATVPEVLRLHPAVDYWDFDGQGKAIKRGTHPAMLTRCRSRPSPMARTAQACSPTWRCIARISRRMAGRPTCRRRRSSRARPATCAAPRSAWPRRPSSRAHIKRLFAQAGHAVTKEVKNAIFLKNDALSIAEELSVALSESEGASFEPMVAASRDAQVYEAAFGQAFEAYARQEIYQALADCEERMGRALVLAQHLPLSDGREKVAVNVTEARMGFVWTELKALAQDRPEAQRRPAVEELGTLDLGPFADRNFVSPDKTAQTRKLQRAGALLCVRRGIFTPNTSGRYRMQTTATSPASRFSGSKALTIFLSLSSAAVIVLALLGYGVALAAEASFGIPHAVIFSSTSDLLTLGGWAVLHMLNYLGRLSEWELYVGLWEKTWPVTKMALILAGTAFAVGFAAFGVQHLAGRWYWLRVQATQARALVAAHGRLARIAAFPIVMLACIFLAVPLMTLASLFGLTLLACFLSIVPIAGLEAGTGHIDKWVIGPEICIPVRSRDTRLQVQPSQQTDASKKPKAATCVTVKKAGDEEHRGRVVFATFNAVVLYDPGAGSVRRVSTDGASVEVIDTLRASGNSSRSP